MRTLISILTLLVPLFCWAGSHSGREIGVADGDTLESDTSPQRVKRASGFQCSGKTKCKEMDSCEEAYFYLKKCGVSRLDRDHDGVPCESICGSN
jgi:Excalibur calcium-binding domain